MQITGWCLPAHILLLFKFMLHLVALLESQCSGHGAGLMQASVSLMPQQRQQRDAGRLGTPELSPQQQVEGGVSILVSELLPTLLSCLVGQFL